MADKKRQNLQDLLHHEPASTISAGAEPAITALTDALGNLIDLRLLLGQVHDLRGTAALIEGLIRSPHCRSRV